MNINRAGRQAKAFCRSENAHTKRWLSEKPITDAEKAYGRFLIAMERQRGFAAGWIAGVAWVKRQRTKGKE